MFESPGYDLMGCSHLGACPSWMVKIPEDSMGLSGSDLYFPFPSLGMPDLRLQKYPLLGEMCRRHVCSLLALDLKMILRGKVR